MKNVIALFSMISFGFLSNSYATSKGVFYCDTANVSGEFDGFTFGADQAEAQQKYLKAVSSLLTSVKPVVRCGLNPYPHQDFGISMIGNIKSNWILTDTQAYASKMSVQEKSIQYRSSCGTNQFIQNYSVEGVDAHSLKVTLLNVEGSCDKTPDLKFQSGSILSVDAIILRDLYNRWPYEIVFNEKKPDGSEKLHSFYRNLEDDQ